MTPHPFHLRPPLLPRVRPPSLIPRKRSLSTAPASPSVPPRPRIVSRRALERHRRSHPPLIRPPPPAPTKKVDDSSWPLPMRVAGYSALALSVPYGAATVISESEKARDFLEGDRPDDDNDHYYGKMLVETVRRYWGVEEALPYPEALRLEVGGGGGGIIDVAPEGGSEAPRSLESELPLLHSRRRAEQAEIERLRHAAVRVRATAAPIGYENGELGICAEREMGGSEPATADAVAGALRDAGIDPVADGAVVAIDFVDDDGDGDGDDEMAEGAGGGRTVEFGGGGDGGAGGAAASLLRRTQTFSAWHYDASWSSAPPSNGASGAAAATAGGGTDGAGARLSVWRVRELEERERQLSADLRDPGCTRDFDDVRRERDEVRAELWRARGWGGRIRSVLPF